MPTPINQARNELTSIKLKHGVTKGYTFNFENTDLQKRTKQSRFATLCHDGIIRCEWVSSSPSKSVEFHAGNTFVWTGILLEFVPLLGVNEAEIISRLEKSPLVFALRKAMAEGKFAPIMSSSK